MLGKRRTLITCGVIYLFAQIFFLINIQFPRTVNFDEFHYVPSAKQFIALQPNRNWEHPPLGKEIMAVGIAIAGDQPLGWRCMSTFFGALTLVGMYILALVLFKNHEIAVWVTLLTLCNQLLYVQSRIGMLDTFMFAFLVWGLAAFGATWSSKTPLKQTKQLLAFTGLMLGLGTACKWFVIVPWVAICLLILAVRLLQTWQMVFTRPREEDWYRSNLWRSLTWKDLVLCLGVIPVAAYFVTFIPYIFIPGVVKSPLDFFRMQYQMWDGQLRVVSSHPYMSHWSDWAFLRRPIWYAFDREGPANAYVRGVLLLGNPLIMWTGIAALIICLQDWLRERNWDAFFIIYFYAVFYGCWIIIPRKISFYYYYYPAGMILSLALGYIFYHLEDPKKKNSQWPRWIYLSAALGLFIYFFPILAGLRIPSESFRNWMWFGSWI